MATAFRIGQRVSFDSNLCTVRYIGPVAGTKKEWLGVEWDDPTRGKHDGAYQGLRYFSCRSRSRSAASFVRPTRIADTAQSFLEAVHQKYAPAVTTGHDILAVDYQIEISGKLVEEVGFEKIRRQLAQLHELKIVIVDGLRIVNAKKWSERRIGDICPRIQELDLSRNLFQSYEEIISICRELNDLRILRLNGNRLQILPGQFSQANLRDAFKGIRELGLDEVLLSWDEICDVVAAFPDLTSLLVDSNELRSLNAQALLLRSMSRWSLKTLKLEYNKFLSLADILPLISISCLETLHLKGNHIEAITDETHAKPVFGTNLQYVDLSYNNVKSWDFVDELPGVFPGMGALRFSHNPVYEGSTGETSLATATEEGYMFTLARIANLKILNFSNITTADRTNAEMFYLSQIGRAMAAVPVAEEYLITKQHNRYDQLCQLYGAPIVVRVSSSVNPDFLDARLIRFHFHMSTAAKNEHESTIIKTQEIPKNFDIYQVKGIVGGLFKVRPLSLKLIWETGEWDPVAGYEDQDENSDEEDELGNNHVRTEEVLSEKILGIGQEKGGWMRREVELEDGTRQIGFWVDAMEATIRVEPIM